MRWTTPGAMAKPCHRGRRTRFLELILFVAWTFVAWTCVAAVWQQATALDVSPGCGELRVAGADSDSTARFPLRHTDVRAGVSGGIASVTVEQRFHNPYDRGIEAVYVFPLPHEAAVDDLEIRIGERVVRGRIHERGEARQIYETAKSQGRVAALLDQERPNIFTQQVANIQPGQEIVVRLHYVESLPYADGRYEFVFPTVVGPRYIPGRPLGRDILPAGSKVRDGAEGSPEDGAARGTGWAPDTDRVPDASRITPPVIPPGMRTGHDIAIMVDIETGVPIQDLASVNHVVDVERRGRSAASVRLRPSDSVPNKDFVLRIAVAGPGPEFGLLAHRDPGRHDGFGFFTLQLQPQAEVGAREARPKEMVFVLDCSGSMHGEPIAKSKAAMRWALQHLGPDDSFQIIRFSESASPFAPRPVPNTPDNVARALAYIEQLQGQGGTEMLSGIRAALDFPRDPERLRLVCFMTDGYIGNEEEIFAAVRQRIGDARLFSFGIGSSVNRYLLDGLAEEGRGEVDYVALDAGTREVVERFYERIAKPYLTDVQIDWGRLGVQDIEPARLPDVFAGQPLVVAGRYTKGGRGEIVVRGRLGRKPFERRLRVHLPERDSDRAAIGTLWARRRIDGLMRQMVRGERADLVREVTDTALAFRLVSRYTSFVAVDNQVVAADGKPMLVPQPVEMPEGVSYEGVFGVKGEPAAGTVGASAGVLQGAQLHVRGGRSATMSMGLPPSMALPVAVPPPAPFSSESKAGPAVKSSDVARVPTQGQVLSLPVESVAEAVALNNAIDLDAAALEVKVTPEKPRLRAGETIRIRVAVTNRGRTAMTLPKSLALGDDALSIQVFVAGQRLPSPAAAKPDPPAKTLDLEPGATHTYVVTLNAPGGYRIGAAGRYTIVIAALGATPLGEPVRCTFDVLP